MNFLWIISSFSNIQLSFDFSISSEKPINYIEKIVIWNSIFQIHCYVPSCTFIFYFPKMQEIAGTNHFCGSLLRRIRVRYTCHINWDGHDYQQMFFFHMYVCEFHFELGFERCFLHRISTVYQCNEKKNFFPGKFFEKSYFLLSQIFNNTK